MAIQIIKGPFMIPHPPSQVGNAPSYSSLLIDAVGEKVGAIVTAPKTGNIARFGFCLGNTVTGSTVDCRVETVTGTPGVPSGTLWGTNTNGAVVIAAGDDNTSKLATLTAAAAVTKGDVIALVVDQSDGNTNVHCFGDENPHLPYSLAHSAVAWFIQTFRAPCVWVEYDDNTVLPCFGCYPFHLINSATINTGSTPDVVGMRFQLPFPARITGAWCWIELDGDATVKLVSTAYHQVNGTGILASKALSNSNRATTGPGLFYVDFTATYDIAANTDYRLIIEPSTTTNMVVYNGSCSSLLQMDGYPGGSLWPYTSAKDPTADGSWTNYNNGVDGYRRLLGGLLFEGFGDDAGGAAGMLGRNPGQGGGLL